MPIVVFVDPSGQDREVSVPLGHSLMQAAIRANVSGIEATCGGGLACATCHVYVAPEWAEQLPPPSAEETSMLDFVEAPRTSFSRLSCQIHATAGMEGLTLTVPAG